MNMNIKKMAQNRLNSTKFGRLLKRVVSEESGQTAMEYVVIATLIAAAVAVGVWLFGGQILGMFHSADAAVAGGHKESEEIGNAVRGNVPSVIDAGASANNKWTDDPENRNSSNTLGGDQ